MWLIGICALALGFLLGRLDALRRFNNFVRKNPPICEQCVQNQIAASRWKENSEFDLSMANSNR